MIPLSFLHRLAVLLPLLGISLFVTHATAELLERFDEGKVNRSFYTPENEWKKFNSGDQMQPSQNRATTRLEADKHYLSLLAYSHPTANARVYRNVDLPVSGSSNRQIAIELRPVSPQTDGAHFRGVSLGLAASRNGERDPDGPFSMGFTLERGEWVAFFVAGRSQNSRVSSKAGNLSINPDEWHRFEADLNPDTGRVMVTVYELKEGEKKQIWQATNEGCPPWSAERFSQINLVVIRPGTGGEHSHSADFANLSITP